jgi:two-component system, OmpR family, phosphate regulon response regulator OmpR
MNQTIWVTDDDDRLRDLVQRYLQQQGFSTQGFRDAESTQIALKNNRPDLLVLDLMLPQQDGLSFCRNLRGQNDLLPILMLTARSDEIDRILGLEMGADDYLAKPFNTRELLARIQAILRRTRPVPIAEKEETYTFSDFIFAPTQRQLHKTNTLIELTNAEFNLLSIFVRHPNQPLSRDRLMQLAKKRDADVFDRSIDVVISRLRKRLEVDPSQPKFLQTVWGIGYVFIADVSKNG